MRWDYRLDINISGNIRDGHKLWDWKDAAGESESIEEATKRLYKQ